LEVDACLARGQLHCDWTYSQRIHQQDTIEALAYCFLEALHTLIGHCRSPGVGAFTPSDFPKMALSQEELDELMTAMGNAAEGS
jgi:non-ribosomal peptide synthase protein (TIGR01720 family)